MLLMLIKLFWFGQRATSMERHVSRDSRIVFPVLLYQIAQVVVRILKQKRFFNLSLNMD